MNKRNVYLAQISTMYGNSLFLPYSAGSLWAYAQTIPAIAEVYELKGFLVRREPIADIVNRLDDPAVLGLSCYQWNWAYSHALAQAVKDTFPLCLIVMGGPQVPSNPLTSLFAEHPYVDVIVHGEGERTFADILLELLQPCPNLGKVDGLTFQEVVTPTDDRQTVRTRQRARLSNLAKLPSPYLSGLFDELLADADYDWQAVLEQTRGCPYQCDFCDWGSATFSKLYQFPDYRIIEEFDWCGRNKIRFAYSADANFGILKRDVELTRALIDTKAIYEYPKEFRMCSAKNSGERVFQIASLLHEAGMCKGATLSLQSLDPHTLQSVHRSNIKMDDFAHWMNKYHESGIATYTEMIIGLPGETYDSFATGIDTILNAGQHEHINAYMLQLLPNSEMSDPAYIAKHGLKSVRMPVLLQHSTPQPDDITEYHDIVIETATMPQADWERAYMFAWAVQTFHCMGLTRLLAIWLHHEHGMSYRAFYEKIIEQGYASPFSSIGTELFKTQQVVKRALTGEMWDVIEPRYGNVIWPTEEISFLRLASDKRSLRQTLMAMLSVGQLLVGWPVFDLREALDLLHYQLAMVKDPYRLSHLQIDTAHNWQSYFEAVQCGVPISLVRGGYRMEIAVEPTYDGDLEGWARETAWYGRKSGSFLCTDVQETALVS